MQVIQPYCRILGMELEVQFTETPCKNKEDQKQREVEAFGVYAKEPDNVDVWVHEFCEWGVADLLPFKKNKYAIAHVMVSFHTVSGNGDYEIQSPEDFTKNLSKSKYNCILHKVVPQKRLDRWILRSVLSGDGNEE